MPAGPPFEDLTIVQLARFEETGDSYYRMRWPLKQLAEQEPSWRIINLEAGSSDMQSWSEAADILILNQWHGLELMPVIDRRKEFGRPTIVEYNDNFYAPQKWNPVAQVWESPILQQSYESFMREADALTVTCDALRSLFSRIVPFERIHILPNHMPSNLEKFEETQRGKNALPRVGWAGSVGHMADLLAHLRLIEREVLASKQASLWLMGNASISDFVHLPRERFRFFPWGPMQNYFHFLSQIDIGVVLLLPTPYNDCRSDIKAVEMSACGVVPILPDAPPYKDFIRATDLTPYRSGSELKRQLNEYIADGDLRRKVAARCYEYVAAERLGHARHERRLLLSGLSGKIRNRSDFKWQLGPGYHECRAAAPSTAKADEVTMKAQLLLQDRQHAAAAAVLEGEVARNPKNPDVLYALLQVLHQIKHPQLAARLEGAISHFPRDMRFQMLLLRLHLTSSAHWDRVLDEIKNAGRGWIGFLRGGMISLFCQALKTNRGLIDKGAAMIAFYPSCPDLLIALGETAEALERDDQALDYFKKALICLESHTPAPDRVQRGYLQAMVEALEARQTLN